MRKNYFLLRLMPLLAVMLLLTTSVSAQLYINEFMASNNAAYPGPQGDYPDWIEIYNAGDQDVNLGGYFIYDTLDVTVAYEIPSTYPDSVTVPAGGFIVFYANKDEEFSVLNLNFKLSGGGEQIGLWNPDQEPVDMLTYDAQITDVSYGRMPDGSDNWQSFINHPVIGFTASPGKSNITLKINELVAKNDNGIQDEFGNYGDWIELYNYGEKEVDITGMFMSDMVDNPTLYSFNPTVIPSEGYLLIWCDGTDEDIITDPDTLHANFKLGAGGETVLLSYTEYTIIDSLTFGQQTADISYGRYPDGTDNWIFFSVPTPRESNTLTAGPVITEVVREPMFPEYTDEVSVTANVTTSETGLSVTLKYNAGQGYIDVEMESQGDDMFSGSIPAMEKGTYVKWYIEATDDAPSVVYYPTDGSAAPLSYQVTDWTPVEVYDMPFDEPSGLAYNALTGTLFTNNDGTVSNIYEISTTAELLNTLIVNGSDFEGIAFSINYDTIFVVEEANWKVVMLNLSGDIIGEFEVDHNPAQVNGLEGITVDPETRHLYVLAEKNEPQLIELTVDGVELFRKTLDFSPDVSGITIHPTWNTLFILSDEASSLNEVTKTGDFLRSWYIPLDQAEGVTFGENENVIYMVADRGSKLYNFDFNFDPYTPPPKLYINEFMASNDTAFPGPQGDYPDWIEIYNAGDEDIMLGGYFMSDILDDPGARYQIPDTYPDSVTVPSGGYILFYANKGEASSVLNLPFKLSSSGEAIGLWDSSQLVVDNLTYGAQTSDISYGRYPDGADAWGFMSNYTPGAPNQMFDPPAVGLYINEFMASNDDAVPGPQGDYPDWIEIYNAGAEDVMLGGYYMADDLTDPEAMYQIPDTYPDSVTVPAGGFIVFYANKDVEWSVLNLGFKLSGGGEQVGLWDPNQNVLDSLTYGPQTADTSYGRYPDGTDMWYIMPDYTPGAPNVYTDAINENESNVALSQNYPNPFTGETHIEFDLNSPDHVNVTVYSITGAVVAVIADDQLAAGKHILTWNASGLPAGYYILNIRTSTGTTVKKMTKTR